MDVAQGRTAQAHGSGHIAETAVHQDNIRTVDGHIGSGADGDADVGPGQGGGVVDSVADHGDHAALLKLSDDRFLPVGQDVGYHPVNPGLRTDGFGGTRVVTGQHTDLDAHLPEGSNRFRRVALDHVGHRDYSKQPAVFGKEQRRFPLFRQRRGSILRLSRHAEQALYIA